MGAENIYFQFEIQQRLISQQQMLEMDEVSGMQPTKKVKIDPTLYLIDKKIIVFVKFDQDSALTITLTDIAESISKPAHISQYQINETSLLRAKALGYSSGQVLDFLTKHSRNGLSNDLSNYIRQVMETQAATKLYLFEEKEKNYYVFEHGSEFSLPYDIEQLLQKRLVNAKQYAFREQGMEVEDEKVKREKGSVRWKVQDYKHNELFKRLFQKKIPVLSEKVIQKFQIANQLRRNAEFYKKKEALHCQNIKISLKAFTKLREYQSEALKAVVQHSTHTNTKTAKSGYIVLPCGAGKTLLGIAICAKIKKETLIVCSSDSGAQQWKREIEKWTQGVSKQQIIILTAKANQFQFKVKDRQPHIFISTYSNLKAKLTGGDVEEGKKEVKIEHEWMKLMPWGLIIFDQAQWLPAPGNSLITDSLMAHVKIGLTATPLREDQNIKSLIYMIGPRLYEGSWRKFVEYGYLANPKCLQIRTKLTKKFQEIFDRYQGRQKKQEAVFECNPNKIKTLLLLLQHHEALGDQIIVFCDRISIINFLARTLKRPLLTGDTSIEDRNFVFDMFREGVFKTVFLSRIGDEAIDLPNASVGIEINIHKGSRRQMLQRLGRIMRPKDCNVSSSYNAMFYTIVTDNTPEIRYFNKRRECLINLGFQYDLRFSEYGEDSMSDIFKDDNSEAKNRALSKFNEIMKNEQDFWANMNEGQAQRESFDSYSRYKEQSELGSYQNRYEQYSTGTTVGMKARFKK